LLRVRDVDRLEEVLEFLDAAGAPGKEVLASRGAGFAAVLLSLENVHGFSTLRADLQRRFGGGVLCEEGLGAVSVVGVGISADGGLVCRGLAALQGMGIPVNGVHSTALRLTLLVPADRLPEAVQRLHGEFLPNG
ncbi:MAG: aspartate kinase, partial [Catenulispora sp.]